MGLEVAKFVEIFPSQSMGFLHMPKELNDFSDRVLSHWFPPRKSSHVGAGRNEDRAVTEAWEGRGGAGAIRMKM